MNQSKGDPGYNDARERLAKVAENLEIALSDIDRGWVCLPANDAALLLSAISAFLSGESPSLDSAFGLSKPRGRPKSGPSNDKARAFVKAAMNSEAKTWEDLADDATIRQIADLGDASPDYLRKLIKRHREDAVNELRRGIVDRVARKAPKRRPPWQA